MRRLVPLIFVGLLLLSVPLWALVALIGSGVTAASADTNSVTSGSYTTTGGDLAILAASDYEGATKTSASDSKSNSYSDTLTEHNSGTGASGRIRLIFKPNATVGAGHTFTLTGTGTFVSIAAMVFSGGHLTSPADVQNGAGMVVVTTQPTGTVTPSENNEVCVSAASWSGSTSAIPTIDGGFSTPIGTNFNGGVNFGVAMSYLIQTTATAANPTWTFDAGSSGAVMIACFKQAAGGGGGTSHKNLLLLGVGN